MNKKYIALLSVLFLVSCASTTPPRSPENMCDILNEKPDWGIALEKTRDKWGAPPQIVLSILYQESSFKHDAKPPKDYFLGIIPMGRVSSAYGYPQAKDEVWGDYKKENQLSFVSRDNFADAVDFVGWYMHKSQSVNGTSKWDAYHQYLNYHEGWGGYSRGTYHSKGWLLNVAKKVQQRAEQYGAQYMSCRVSL
ncbi:hypothetical protein [Pelistega ratti]|uniref:transglycosylase SLT domain-containing protein n=1 Tax=Pelistega ratti TaxID=2652177 RepID=UPI001359B179|nr:hypothetical protein [Pelistega ratti]